jgi:hypothetical protein
VLPRDHDIEFFEFVIFFIEDPFGKKRLPEKFTLFLDSWEPTKVQLRENGCGFCRWATKVLFEGQGQIYLHNGWKHL